MLVATTSTSTAMAFRQMLEGRFLGDNDMAQWNEAGGDLRYKGVGTSLEKSVCSVSVARCD
jgi:hypothetical protein